MEFPGPGLLWFAFTGRSPLYDFAVLACHSLDPDTAWNGAQEDTYIGKSWQINMGHLWPQETPIQRLINAHYPSQYVVRTSASADLQSASWRDEVSRLRKGQEIDIDGRLEEDAWAEVPWLQKTRVRLYCQILWSGSWQKFMFLKSLIYLAPV